MKRFNKKWVLPLALTFTLSLGIAGCSNDTEEPQTNEPAVEENVEETGDDAQDAADDAANDAEDAIREMNYEDIKFTPEQAFDKFMELHPEASIKVIDLDKELMEYQYVIEGHDDENQYEVKLNPVNGEVISDDAETVVLDEENAEITKDQVAKVDSIIEKAKAEDGSDSELDEWNISVRDDKVIMDVEIGLSQYSYDMETEELVENGM